MLSAERRTNSYDTLYGDRYATKYAVSRAPAQRGSGTKRSRAAGLRAILLGQPLGHNQAAVKNIRNIKLLCTEVAEREDASITAKVLILQGFQVR